MPAALCRVQQIYLVRDALGEYGKPVNHRIRPECAQPDVCCPDMYDIGAAALPGSWQETSHVKCRHFVIVLHKCRSVLAVAGGGGSSTWYCTRPLSPLHLLQREPYADCEHKHVMIAAQNSQEVDAQCT